MKASLITLLAAALLGAGIVQAQNEYAEIARLRGMNQTVRGIRSMADGEHYTTLEGSNIIRHSYAAAGPGERMLPSSAANLTITDYSFSPDERQILIASGSKPIYRHSYTTSYFLAAGNSLTPVLREAEAPRDASFSPDSRLIAYSDRNDLYVYDTAARQAAAPDALWDVAYYNGRYYVYFGIVPCLLFQLPFEALTGIRDLPPALPMILLAWLYILAVFGFVKQAARRWFPQASAAAYLLTAAGAASGTQIYYLLHRPSVYEYAILCGATFVLWALWQWLCAANTPVNRRKALTFHLAFGSLCMALVAGCRPQMVLFAALAPPILWPRYITEKRLCTRRGAGEAAAFILPVVLVAVGLMWYNAARFGSPFDFGANYNLTSNDMTHRGFRIGRLAPALFTYFLSLPVVQAVFPYLAGTKMQTNFMGMTITEVFYGGALVSLPLLWAFAALPLLRRRMARQKDLRAMVLLPVLLAVILAALDCQMAGVLYRYLSDYLTPLLFAAALVWLWAESALAPRVQAAASGSILHTVQHMLQGAMLAAVAVGICYSFCVYFAAEPGLLGQNPALYQNVSRLVQFWL